MKYLLAAVLSIASTQALAGDVEVIEAGKRKAAREFKELRSPQFRGLSVLHGHDGKPVFVCGEVSAKNRPAFTRFFVYLDDKPGEYQRGVDSQAMDELVDAVCDTPPPKLKS